MDEERKVRRKLAGQLGIIAVLVVCLCVTTFALAYPSVTVGGNVFQMGKVQINLNDGESILQADHFEPGATALGTFFVENQSSIPVHCRLYLENVSGDLAQVLDMTLKCGDEILYSGTPEAFTKEHAAVLETALAVKEKREFLIMVHYPESAGNTQKGTSLSFDITVDAVQTKNNPDKLFA